MDTALGSRNGLRLTGESVLLGSTKNELSGNDSGLPISIKVLLSIWATNLKLYFLNGIWPSELLFLSPTVPVSTSIFKTEGNLVPILKFSSFNPFPTLASLTSFIKVSLREETSRVIKT